MNKFSVGDIIEIDCYFDDDSKCGRHKYIIIKQGSYDLGGEFIAKGIKCTRVHKRLSIFKEHHMSTKFIENSNYQILNTKLSTLLYKGKT